MHLSVKPLVSASAIRRIVSHLAHVINCEYEGRELHLLVVLKGSVIFAADLMRQLDMDVRLNFIRARSYDGRTSTGSVEFTLLPESSLQGKHVLVVEDILDTGRTCAAILKWVRAQSPASVAVCTLLDKPERRVKRLKADYAGLVIPDHFVVGYGLDYNERYRRLPEIYALECDPPKSSPA